MAVASTCLGQGRIIYLCQRRLLCFGNDCHFHRGQALEIIRGCQGLNVVGCDLVEVSPPYDLSGECGDKHDLSCWSKSDSSGELGLQVYLRDPTENQCPEARGKPVTTHVRSVS